ncbi:STM4012 family radical SAM protein [Rhodococcus phenolicus]|uniref:STM4012 family radical SAM protein n=1 Tax=Rhodococcus phenolicus TaxID=263849 RepID=UPI00082DA461|nr:STM4012 family radical SAM protein [Rhodococcus phenolicus]
MTRLDGTDTAVDLDGSPYQGYLYAYPHKSAYRPLRPAPPLRQVWAGQDRSSLFLYAHIPFCEMRCGFCNLFTTANPPEERVGAYLAALRRQARQVRTELDAAGPDTARFAAAAIGGGTPTYLEARELDALFDILTEFAPELPRIPSGVETSPATATADRVAVLADRGVHRVSIGVQSFLDHEAHAAGRPQKRAAVDAALDRLQAAGFGIVNLDLIYGIDGQTPETWQYSLDTALARCPEEIYLYPLYVRPLTGLGRRAGTDRDTGWDAQRLALYRQGVEALTAAGYRQHSMRQFRRGDVTDVDTDYCCQDDGMVGLGCGARSYTTDLHYSFDYAVGVPAVRAILDEYTATDDFGRATVGTALDEHEQRRRWLIKTLLRADGVDLAAYTARFGGDLHRDIPGLDTLTDRGWAHAAGAGLRLTDAGLARSDLIGPWLVSESVRASMTAAVLR